MNAIEGAGPATRLFVLEAGSIVEIDYTASEVLLDVIKSARKSGVDFAVARLESVRAQAAFDRFGVTTRLDPTTSSIASTRAVRALAGDIPPSAANRSPHQP